MIETRVLTKDEASQLALGLLFNSMNSPIACSQYGGGGHCDSPERNEKKLVLWGGRGEDASNPLKCHIIYTNEMPAGLVNIGVTGNPPTVMDRRMSSEEPGKVLETSVFVADRYMQDQEVQQAVRDVFSEYTIKGYSALWATVAPSNEYGVFVFRNLGGVGINKTSVEEQLGLNALHPERFRFSESGSLEECTKWDKDAGMASHGGWHDSNPCSIWVDKVGFAFSISEVSGQLEIDRDEL